MRPQLFAGGLLVALMGAGFFLLEIPFLYFWSLPFIGGGVIMMVGGFLLPESTGPVIPPEGHRFCVFCSTPVRIGEARCPHCNGLQPKEGGG